MFNFRKEKSFIFVEKPDGVSTHTPIPDGVGFIEFVSQTLQEKLYPPHRLDRDTSGALVFCTDKESTTKLRMKFEKLEVKKNYLLVTDRLIDKNKLSYKNFIAKKDGEFIINSLNPPNSETDFEIIKQVGKFSLLRAFPKTGKPHQIRIHAKELGFPILGDTKHAGSDFFRLMLHAEQIEFEFENQIFTHKSDPPLFFNNLNLSDSSDILRIENEFYKRKYIFNFSHDSAIRIIHEKESLGFKCDYYAGKLWIYWYKDSLINNSDQDLIKKLTEITKCTEYHISYMVNKGATTNLTQSISSYSSLEWQCKENNATYELKSSQGASAGLFIDQRANRRWIKENSLDKNVLNLFSYTCSLGLVSALGGAKSVTSVDTSKTSHEWAKKNFDLSGICKSLEDGKIKFITADAREYLDRILKKDEKFDLIICDPPSFARSKTGIFSFENDFEQLFKKCILSLTNYGQLLFSTNFEKWNEKELLLRAKKIADLELKDNYSISLRVPDFDCGLPTDNTRLKTVLLERRAQLGMPAPHITKPS